MKCKDCKYFELLTDHPESWGTCEWFEKNWVKAPFWVRLARHYGAISPTTNICKVGKPK